MAGDATLMPFELEPEQGLKRSRPRSLGVLLCAMSLVLALALASILCFSEYFNYGAEGIELGALLRLASGKPYITRLPDIPWYVNQYSPYFYALAQLPVKLLGLGSLYAVAFCARTMTLLTTVALICSVYHAFAEMRFSRQSFVVVSLWFLLLFPANIVAVRPDFLAFLVEFWAFVVWRHATRSVASYSLIFIAGLLFGTALALKLNTIGIVGGLILFQVRTRRWVRASLLMATTILSALVFILVSFRVWGASALHDTFLAIQNQTEAPVQLAKRLSTLALTALPFAVITVVGFSQLRREERGHTTSIAYALLTSVAIATLQQLKVGSWFNYYYGAFALALGPAAVGLDKLATGAHRGIYRTLLGAALAQTAWAARVPVVVARDYMLNRYPYPLVQAWFQNQLPKGPIYSNDPSASLHFRDRALLGPDAEIILDLTPALRSYLPRLRQNMLKTPYAAAIITGPSCQRWRPVGTFRLETSKLTNLVRQFGWICVFMPGPSFVDQR